MDKIEKLHLRMEKLKAREQALLAQEKEKERKERTRKLIRIGAIFEKELGGISFEKAEFYAKLLKKSLEDMNN